MARRICDRKSLEEVRDPNYFQKDYDDNELYDDDERKPSEMTTKIAKVNKLQLKALNMTQSNTGGGRFKTLNYHMMRAGHNTASAGRYGGSKDEKPLNTKTVIERIFNPAAR